jgi:hypothetical protein
MYLSLAYLSRGQKKRKWKNKTALRIILAIGGVGRLRKTAGKTGAQAAWGGVDWRQKALHKV